MYAIFRDFKVLAGHHGEGDTRGQNSALLAALSSIALPDHQRHLSFAQHSPINISHSQPPKIHPWVHQMPMRLRKHSRHCGARMEHLMDRHGGLRE
jgi:hypothetical protein